MAERNLRGMRLGSQSLQSEEGVEFVPRRKSVYRTADGSTFEVTFASDADIPEVWESPRTGQEGRLVAEDGSLVETEVVETKAPRTHWDMLLERRSIPELEDLLEERLSLLRAGTLGHPLLDQILIGSVTRTLISVSKVPVLVVKK